MLAACVHLLKHVREIFNKTVDTPGSSVVNEKQRNNRVQTRAIMTQMLDRLQNEPAKAAEPGPAQTEDHVLVARWAPQDLHAQRHLRLHMR